MSDPKIVKILDGRDESMRVVICRRADGRFTYNNQLQTEGEWGAAGPDCGIYPDALTAENEARLRVEALRGELH